MTTYGPNLFKGTAPYYTRYRPPYPASLIRFLVQTLALDGTGKLLDLGCGTGQLTLRLSDWFEQITGVDQEKEMIDEARRLQEIQRVTNVNWLIGDLESPSISFDSPFHAVVIAKAFHWMDRRKTLERLYPLLENGGSVAIVDPTFPAPEKYAWQTQMEQIVRKWYGSARRAGNATYQHPEISHQEILLQSPFRLENHTLPSYTHHWTVESLLGNLYSTSYGSRHYLGDDRGVFEAEFKQQLINLHPNNLFPETIQLSVLLAVK